MSNIHRLFLIPCTMSLTLPVDLHRSYIASLFNVCPTIVKGLLNTLIKLVRYFCPSIMPQRVRVLNKHTYLGTNNPPASQFYVEECPPVYVYLRRLPC